MNVLELAQRLYEEGCSSSNYAINTQGWGDLFYLSHDGSRWKVCYTERGQDSPPIYTSENESEACEFFFQHVMSMRHDHCVGFFKAKQNSEALKGKLKELGLAFRSDVIPYGGPSDPRFRVFVVGKDIFPAREAFGDLPLCDPDA